MKEKFKEELIMTFQREAETLKKSKSFMKKLYKNRTEDAAENVDLPALIVSVLGVKYFSGEFDLSNKDYIDKFLFGYKETFINFEKEFSNFFYFYKANLGL